MQPIELTVRIEPDLPSVVKDAVSFETGASRLELSHNLCVYEHHGPEFSPGDRGALPAFFEDLILGRPLPFVFATRSLQDVDTVLAIALFLQRDLAVHPATAPFVSLVDFVHRLGLPALAHVGSDEARFLCMIRSYLPETGLSKRETASRLSKVIEWMRAYILQGEVPHLGVPPVSVRIVDRGTNGFVLAETAGSLFDGWVELYRQGFLRGLLVNVGSGDRRHVLAARKSTFIQLDLEMGVRLLNEMERAMGELPEWKTDGFWLESPPEGSLLLVSHIMDVLIRL